MRAVLDHKWPADHKGDCGGTVCGYCGCCMHTPANFYCKVNDAPAGMRCPESGCGCEGRM